MSPKPSLRGFPTRASWKLTAAALVALAAAACSDTATAPLGPESGSADLVKLGKKLPLELPGLGGGSAQLFSNRVKYRSSAGSNATGRSGTATLAASAVLTAGDTVWLTATTGDLEALAAAPGEIVKLQVKISSPQGEQLATLNYHDIGGAGGVGSRGSLRIPFTGIPHGSTFRLQANVRGIDGRRTDVVTVSPTVRRAPALQARITAPDQVFVNTPTVITGTVTELNGEVGSRADCVLVVDGVEVDRADGIWVDAGDAVTCAFSHTFASTGGHTVEIRLDDATSGTSLLLGSFSRDQVQVVHPDATTWRMSVEERTTASSNWHWYDFLNPLTGVGRDYSDFDVRYERTQSVAVQGTLNRPTQFPVALVRLRYGSGATGWDNEEWVGLTMALDAEGRECIRRQLSPVGALFYLCSSAAGNTVFAYNRFGGVVTYHSDGFSRDFDPAGTRNVFTWNDTYTEFTTGEQVRPWGSDVWVRISVTDALGTFSIEPVAQLTPFSGVVQARTESCEDTFPYWLDGGRIHACFASEVLESGQRGEGEG